jgi:hypothetical protein
MKKEFVPFDLSLRLKELGFDEPHFGLYGKSEANLYKVIGDKFDVVDDIHFIKAPTYSQAFRWFREKRGIEGFLHKAIEGTYYFVIKRIGNNESNMYEFIKTPPKNVDTYEEAELACLEKLIKIIENK